MEEGGERESERRVAACREREIMMDNCHARRGEKAFNGMTLGSQRDNGPRTPRTRAHSPCPFVTPSNSHFSLGKSSSGR